MTPVPREPMAVPAHDVSPWNVPNALTLGRILLVPVFGALLLTAGGATAAYRYAALGVFLAAMATDRLDGELARRHSLITNVGKILDPIADKALLGMAFVGLSLIDLVPWWVTEVVLVREIGITAVRFVVIRHGVIPAGRGGKLKTLLQTIAVTLLLLPHWQLPAPQAWRLCADLALGAAVLMTVVSGVDYLLQAHRLRSTSPRALAREAQKESP